jgi:hypothetical protein
MCQCIYVGVVEVFQSRVFVVVVFEVTQRAAEHIFARGGATPAGPRCLGA